MTHPIIVTPAALPSLLLGKHRDRPNAARQARSPASDQ